MGLASRASSATVTTGDSTLVARVLRADPAAPSSIRTPARGRMPVRLA
jgi:hypothetical protein